MKTQYTKGPWQVDAFDYVKTSDGHNVATVYSGSPSKITQNEASANARLIAQAPALLEALEALYQQALALDQSATHDGLNNCQALAKARSAINSATQPES